MENRQTMVWQLDMGVHCWLELAETGPSAKRCRSKPIEVVQIDWHTRYWEDLSNTEALRADSPTERHNGWDDGLLAVQHGIVDYEGLKKQPGFHVSLHVRHDLFLETKWRMPGFPEMEDMAASYLFKSRPADLAFGDPQTAIARSWR